MARQILQINFNLNVSRGDYEAVTHEMAQMFADVPGLVSKIWLINDERNEAGGIYLFESERALNDFVNSELAESVRVHPGLKNFSAKPFGILEEVTAITRGAAAAVPA